MDMQNVAKLNISEGDVRTIHDKDGNLIWGKVSYGVKYKGDTAQNGTPTPSAPVAVQTVTGEQTISINGAAHTVNLGSFKLCKIGTYQDYIYKSGDKWYKHKAVGKEILSSNDNWAVRGDASVTDCTVFRNLDYVAGAFATNSQVYSSHFVYATSYSNGVIRTVNANEYGLTPVVPNSLTGITSGDDTTTKATKFKTWLSNNIVSVYYIALTATEEEITNATLVGQLEAVGQWLTRYGYNATVSGNLPIIIDRTAL